MVRSFAPALAVLALAVGMTACTPPASPPGPSGSSTSEGTPPASVGTPTTGPSATVPAVTAIPECDALVSVDRVRTVTGDERLEDFGESRTRTADSLPGPVAAATLEGAELVRTCAWGVPSSPISVTLSVAVIDTQARDTLVDALDESADFARSVQGDRVSYTAPTEGPDRPYLAYVFDGPVWAIVDGTVVDAASSATLAGDAADATRG